MIQRATKFSEGLLRNCKKCPRESLPYLSVSSSIDEESLFGVYYILFYGLYLFLLYFLVFYKGIEVKIQVNRTIEVRLVLSIFGYSLAMSLSYFAKFHTLHDMVIG